MENTNDEFQVMQAFIDLEIICKKLEKRRKYLESEQSIADKKITDIEHYIEFNNLSASQGYKAYKLLKRCLEERRNIKNELGQLASVSKMNIGFAGSGNMQKSLERINNKQYTPRVLTELFE